jgi:lipopolysaccharide transport system ATP-binding protein
MTTVICVENLSKVYHLGQIGTGTFTNDLKAWWAKKRGLPDPLQKVGQAYHGNQPGEELWALKDVSFTVGQGQVLGIIGRNGAGKSTLLKILARVTAPSSGKVRVKGRIASLLEVGTGFHPDLTGRENIYLNGAILGMSREEVNRKFDEIVDFSGVEQFIDTPVKRYSSGMYVRLAFAVAAHLEPEILVVDEVLAVGDAEFQKKCLGKMGAVARAGLTVLFVSHNLLAVKTLCQRGIFLRRGCKMCDDSVNNAITAYLDDMEKPAQSDISLRTDRPRGGGVRLKGIDILCEGKETTLLTVGKSATFHFHITNVLPNISCIFTIYDQYSQPLATFDSTNLGIHDSNLPDYSKVFTCEFPEFTLYPGRYWINVELAVNNDIQDRIESALFFDVVPGRVEGRVIQANSYGKVYMDHSWSCPGGKSIQSG